MIRLFAILPFLLIGIQFQVSAQTSYTKTKEFKISGQVKETRTFAINDLKTFTMHAIGDVAITNHTGEVKGTAKSISGVLLKDILASIQLTAENPKLLSEYYFVCRGSDGYKVVYSWNELFNTGTGNSVYIVTEKEHKPIQELDESILMISTHDVRTGRRYVKNLETIYVGRVE